MDHDVSLDPVEDASVRHLVELGYVDPNEVAARAAERRRHYQGELARALEFEKQGRRQEAVALLEQLAHDESEPVVPHQLLAEIYYQAGRLAEAQREIEWLVHHGIESPRLTLIAGGLALSRRDLVEAVEALSYVRHVEPGLPGVQTMLGTTLLRTGKLEEAQEAFLDAIERNEADAQSLEGLAAIALKRANYEEAADWALQALALNMQIARAHCYLGIALAHLERPVEALQALETGAKMQPNRAAPYRWLAQIAETRLSDPARAARYREAGREIIKRRRHQKGSQTQPST